MFENMIFHNVDNYCGWDKKTNLWFQFVLQQYKNFILEILELFLIPFDENLIRSFFVYNGYIYRKWYVKNVGIQYIYCFDILMKKRMLRFFVFTFRWFMFDVFIYSGASSFYAFTKNRILKSYTNYYIFSNFYLQ